MKRYLDNLDCPILETRTGQNVPEDYVKLKVKVNRQNVWLVMTLAEYQARVIFVKAR